MRHRSFTITGIQSFDNADVTCFIRQDGWSLQAAGFAVGMEELRGVPPGAVPAALRREAENPSALSSRCQLAGSHVRDAIFTVLVGFLRQLGCQLSGQSDWNSSGLQNVPTLLRLRNLQSGSSCCSHSFVSTT